MAYNEYSNCDEDVVDRECDPCGDDIELGGVRDGAFIRDDMVFSDPTSPTEWEQGIADGKIIMVTRIKGTSDGGSPEVQTGFGDQVEQVIGFNYTVAVQDPAYRKNYAFWNTIRKSKRWRWAHFTETRVHIASKPATVKPKNPVEEDIKSIVTWQADITWFQSDLMEFHDATNLGSIRTCSF